MQTLKIHEIRSPRAAQAHMENSEGANRRVKGIYIFYMQISQEHQWDAAPIYGKAWRPKNMKGCDWLDLLVIGLCFVAR